MPHRNPIQTYVGPTERRHLKQEAAARGISISKCVADCLREYFTLKAEMASAVTSPGELGDPHPGGVIHTLLARTEERLAATLDRQVDELLDQSRLLENMIDRLAMFYLVHTPEVAGELHESAFASANRRYANYRRAVDRLRRTGGVNGNATSTESEEDLS